MVQDEPRGEVVPAGDAPREKKPSVFSQIALFMRQVFGELRKVITPTRQELLKYTGVVDPGSLAVELLVGQLGVASVVLASRLLVAHCASLASWWRSLG